MGRTQRRRKEKSMTISEVADKYDITQDTLRYYERIGLIPPVPRGPGGKRDYDEDSCGWIAMMKCFRRAGVQIDALIEYVALYRQGESTADARCAILMSQREKLAANIEEMQQSLCLLDKKIAFYTGQSEDAGCCCDCE